MLPSTCFSRSFVQRSSILRRLAIRGPGVLQARSAVTRNSAYICSAGALGWKAELRSQLVRERVRPIFAAYLCFLIALVIGGVSLFKALRRALRQDPDVILVGEMRDLETIGAAVTAAEKAGG